MNVRAYVGVGANLEPVENIRRALRLLRRRAAVTGVSTFYRTAPLDGREDPPYVNGVWRLAVEDRRDGPQRLQRTLKRIEERLGRRRTADRFASRPIDLDLLLYDGRVLDPQIYRRPFLSLPLEELEPGLVLPDTGRAIREVAALHRESGRAGMEPLESFTLEMRGRPSMNLTRVEELTRELLLEIGEDPDREGLRRTPGRVARSWSFLTNGYRADMETVINRAVFEASANNMIIVRDIELYSLCEHHLLPFFGRCHIGYIAKGKVFGVSKLARIVDIFARRLQLQERLTDQIAQAVRDATGAEGVGVVIEARHLCMMMRGVKKQNSS